jgi:hypothetical protein
MNMPTPTPDRTDLYELYARYSCTFDACDAELYAVFFSEDAQASEVPPASSDASTE